MKNLQIHPVALAKLGLLTKTQAKRLLKAYRMFLPSEIEILLIEAGCVDSHECWTPFRLNPCSPFLIYDEENPA